MYTIGLDIGTQGVRGMVVDAVGRVVTQARASFAGVGVSPKPEWHEQRPEDWWEAAKAVLSTLMTMLDERGIEPADLSAIAIDGTSGTVLALDEAGNPLTAGIMYNDARAVEQVRQINAVAGTLPEKLGYQFNSSYGLPKWLWLKQQHPEFAKARYLVHQTDYIVGRLTGCFDLTDWSNALKSGWDLLERKWPDYIENDLGIPISMLPVVQAPGTPLAKINAQGAKQSTLPEGLQLVAGCSDGYASSIASGAMGPGDCNTTIGTTMVFKAVSRELIKDEQGRIYCHLHPDGWWMPGAASNVGGYCLNAHFDAMRFDALNASVDSVTPTGVLTYPLSRKGERFPFLQPDATELVEGDISDERVHYAALMEGVAYTERLSLEILESLGCEIGDFIYVTGGAVKSPEWSQLRADVLGKTLRQPQEEEAAMGAAILAAAATLHHGISDAVKSMVQLRAEFLPRPERHERYNELYAQFKQMCQRKGWL